MRPMNLATRFVCLFLLTGGMFADHCAHGASTSNPSITEVLAGFKNPPASARPGVYWYFMDGNLSRDGITSDLESMREVGIGHVVFLEVKVGVPRGKVDMLSPQWQDMFKHALRECERLDIEMTLGIGPGWAGSGGPWVAPEQSMQHLVSTSTVVTGPGTKAITLPRPVPKPPYFGEGVFTPELKNQWSAYYQDVTVLAYPTPTTTTQIAEIDEKALYYRAPYTSAKGVKPYLAAPAAYPDVPAGAVIPKSRIVDLTSRLQPDGTITWDVPPGDWTIARFGARNNGAITRPAPMPGLGFEADKFSTAPMAFHLDQYVGKLLRHVGELNLKSTGGLKALHIDSWEMGAQNWTPGLREEFTKRRGYDPQPYYPVYIGMVVDSLEISERFLWDLRLTSQELIIEYHAGFVKEYAHKHGLKLSIEPYDMNPTADLELGAVADIPMCEFWSKGFGFNSAFSCLEAVSIAHVNGAPIVQAEAFTGDPDEAWKQYPGSMKNQGDWAFAAGINRFFYHTFQHQPLDATLKPGMAMGPYGVHWDRNQTFWPMVDAYHQYIARCQHVLQQGRTMADILYLTPEGAPHVFTPPASAMTGDEVLPDRKGFNFDGCAPSQFYKASVNAGRVVFPGGASYRIVVLPNAETMTPELMKKIESLVNAGATVVGTLPTKSPSLTGYPECDKQVEAIASGLQGKLHHVRTAAAGELYPDYDATAELLKTLGDTEDFVSSAPIRYTHKTSADWDIYFVSNRTTESLHADCAFRGVTGTPELWHPVTGVSQKLSAFVPGEKQTTVLLKFKPHESYFVVFPKTPSADSGPSLNIATKKFSESKEVAKLTGPWTVAFDPEWGGPEEAPFENLTDWSTHQEPGIKYYSGIATYRKSFDAPDTLTSESRVQLDLGDVQNLAKVRLNGEDLGVLWTAPWQVDITTAVKSGTNQLEIEVVNLWPNRLIGDEQLPYDGPENSQWPEWITENKPRPTQRQAFTTYQHYKKDSPLLKSGLIGPVTLQRVVE